MCIYIHQKGKHIAYHILPCKIYTSKFHQRKNHLMSNCITVWYLIISRHNMICTSTLSKIEWYHFIKGSLKELPCYGYLWWPRMNGMEWNGLAWIGLDWNGMEMKWTGKEMEWSGMEWNDMAWCHESFQFQILKNVSHESLVFTSATFRFWGTSRTKASFSHVPLSDFEGRLARKLHFHMCHFQILRDVSHESFVFTQMLRDVSHESFIFTSAIFRFWRMSRTKAAFSHLPLSDFEGRLARKLHFHICHFQILRDVSHESFIFTCAILKDVSH